MKSYCILLALALVGCTSVRESGQIGDVKIYRATARGVFSPSSTTLIAAPANGAKNVEDLQVLSAAHGPGFVPAVAQAGGIAGGAALLRPSRNSTSVSGTSNAAATANGGTSTGGGTQFVPPGHVNNPSQNN
jgi:hypothetical protein